MSEVFDMSARALQSARTIVVKIGSALVVDEALGAADRGWLADFARDILRLKNRGQSVVIVSSGAVALGKRRLGLKRKKIDLDQKQAAAAAGQSLLMRAWEEALEPRRITAAQILLTRDDTEVRRRWLNGRATLQTLLALGAVPVVNENDTVATEEIRYGDNDRLAARVAQMVGADLLVLLSDVDGVYTADPRKNPGARRLAHITEIDEALIAMAGGANSEAGVGTGGMATKIAAARIAADAGCGTLIGLGKPPSGESPLLAIEQGAASTLIDAGETPLGAYKQWIAGAIAPAGELVIDDGAAAALRDGKSLLPSGVTEVRGRFDKGDALVVLDLMGKEVARGLASYDSDAALRIKGARSDAIERILGYDGRPCLIHRNDLVLR